MGEDQDDKTETVEAHQLIVYGPVPSRRLGRSLGINNIPSKVCSYSCAYCQVGRTSKMQIDRQAFYEPKQILREVKAKIEQTEQVGEPIDYLTFVPDGEPTLDVNLGRAIDLLRPLGIKVAVITNSTLLQREDIVDELNKTDLVSVKVDTVTEASWRKLNRPHAKLQLKSILNGLISFANTYKGELVTETMLVKGINDDQESLDRISQFLAHLRPSTAYLSIPIRPPAEDWVKAPSESAIKMAHLAFTNKIGPVEFLVDYEGNTFAYTGDVATDLLSITAVHPMREEAVGRLLDKANADWSLVERLLSEGLLIEKWFRGKRFYARSAVK